MHGMEEMLGMPPRKKRSRGKRGRGKGMHGTMNHAEHVQHLKAAHDAVRAGDHAAAKRHAFAFVKSLPSSMQDEPEPMDSPKEEAMEPTMDATATMAPKAAAGGTKGRGALAALMARRKMQG